MKAEIRGLQSPDIPDLARWVPPDPACFGFLLQVLVGPADSAGEESFDLVVCTPEWLRRKYGEHGVLLARHHMLIFRYDFEAIRSTLHHLVSSLHGRDWRELASVLSRYGKWELEDFRE